MGVPVGLEEVALLGDHCLGFFSIRQEVAWKLGERLVVLAFFEHAAHLYDDFIELSFLLSVTALDDIRLPFAIGRQLTVLIHEYFLFVDLGVGLGVIFTPPGVRISPITMHQVVPVPLLDLQVFENAGLGHAIVEDQRNVHVMDQIVVLIRA